jgi:hypothetical protein
MDATHEAEVMIYVRPHPATHTMAKASRQSGSGMNEAVLFSSPNMAG